jgi:hypothetical protein
MPIEEQKSFSAKFSGFTGENAIMTPLKCHVFLLYLRMGILKKAGLLGLCFTLLSGCYSQGTGNSIDATIPDKLAAYSTHTIDIVVKKGPNSSFSKYELDCPPNVTVKEGVNMDGNFSFVNQTAKYVWVESPKTDEFTVTMILEVGNAPVGQAQFTHRYCYIDGETRKEINDGPMYIEFVAGTPKAPVATKNTDTAKTPATNSTPTVASTTQPGNTPLTKNEEPKKTNISITPSGTTSMASNNSNSGNTPVTSTPTTTSSNTTPNSVEVKEYKVQIGSFDSKPSLAKYSNLGRLTVIEENGKYKLLVGAYSSKEEAVKRMEELKTQGHPGFVVLLINGVKAK